MVVVHQVTETHTHTHACMTQMDKKNAFAFLTADDMSKHIKLPSFPLAKLFLSNCS